MECDKNFSYFSLFFSFSLIKKGAYLPQALANKGIAPPAVHCGKFAKILKKFSKFIAFLQNYDYNVNSGKGASKKRAFLAFDYPRVWRAIMILWRAFAAVHCGFCACIRIVGLR